VFIILKKPIRQFVDDFHKLEIPISISYLLQQINLMSLSLYTVNMHQRLLDFSGNKYVANDIQHKSGIH